MISRLNSFFLFLYINNCKINSYLIIGIGKALVERLADTKANIIAVGQTQSKLDSLKEELKNKTKLTTVCVDLGNWKETDKKLSEICKNVDFLVNNAGYGHNCPLDEMPEDELDKVMNINLKAPINLMRMVAPGMKARRFGSIVNVASTAGIAAIKEHMSYAASKAGLDMVTKIGAVELSPFNIRVNSINPTVVWTPLSAKYWSIDNRAEVMKSKIPMNRLVELREVVEPILFLLSESSSMISGIKMPIDGGFVAT